MGQWSDFRIWHEKNLPKHFSPLNSPLKISRKPNHWAMGGQPSPWFHQSHPSRKTPQKWAFATLGLDWSVFIFLGDHFSSDHCDVSRLAVFTLKMSRIDIKGNIPFQFSSFHYKSFRENGLLNHPKVLSSHQKSSYFVTHLEFCRYASSHWSWNILNIPRETRLVRPVFNKRHLLQRNFPHRYQIAAWDWSRNHQNQFIPARFSQGASSAWSSLLLHPKTLPASDSMGFPTHFHRWLWCFN